MLSPEHQAEARASRQRAREEAQASWTPEKRAALSAKMRARWAEHGHPRTGTKDSEETRAKRSAAITESWAIRQAKHKAMKPFRERLDRAVGTDQIREAQEAYAAVAIQLRELI